MRNESETRKAGDGPGTLGRLLIVGILIITVGAVVHFKGRGDLDKRQEATYPAPEASDPKVESRNSDKGRAGDATTEKNLPRLLDIGSVKCIPCKMMAPILEELADEYAGSFRVDFVDFQKKPEVAQQYNIRIIPTQIFIDASGRELFRHEGFYSKKDILAKWRELGIRIETE